MIINSHILRLSGKAELPHEIEIGHNYHISLDGAVVSKTESDNEDNTSNLTYKFKPIKIELLDAKGKTLKLKDTRSSSALFRARLWKQWQESGSDKSFDDWYSAGMLKLISFAPEVAEMYFEHK